ncbi:predicted protein [Coccidioides posadasii str. Silveira]|uniref:Predicted protein n=1 Tax=Coccidioides posadasii (strain RMSCC 757 / Silveira) TaxID=443226 RepID=E9D6C2_COCPS|nr:predicted protein [Coccidioides posadasii str. Silveira]
MNQGPRVVTLCRVSRSHSKDINRFITSIELDNAEPHVMIAFAIGRHHGGPSHHPTNWIFPQACENNPSGGQFLTPGRSAARLGGIIWVQLCVAKIPHANKLLWRKNSKKPPSLVQPRDKLLSQSNTQDYRSTDQGKVEQRAHLTEHNR